MATIDDVARMAGVSKGTVSSVFSKKRPISKEVTERVLAVAEKLHYVPNHVARSLAMKTTMIVGLKMPVESNSVLSAFEQQMVNGVIRECTKHGYRVLLDTLPEKDDVTLFSSDPVDGMIMLNPRKSDPRLERYEKMGIPVVLIGRPDPENEAISFVDNNNREMTRQVGEYLLGKGHTSVLFLNAASDMTVAEDRQNGLRQAYLEAGVPLENQHVLYHPRKKLSSGSDYGYLSIMELGTAFKYTAVITDTERVAMGVLRAARELGMEIPKDLSIIALCNDAALAQETSPKLTAVELSVDRLGSEAAKILIDKMKDASVTRQVIIDAKLVIRDSCASLT